MAYIVLGKLQAGSAKQKRAYHSLVGKTSRKLGGILSSLDPQRI